MAPREFVLSAEEFVANALRRKTFLSVFPPPARKTVSVFHAGHPNKKKRRKDLSDLRTRSQRTGSSSSRRTGFVFSPFLPFSAPFFLAHNPHNSPWGQLVRLCWRTSCWAHKLLVRLPFSPENKGLVPRRFQRALSQPRVLLVQDPAQLDVGLRHLATVLDAVAELTEGVEKLVRLQRLDRLPIFALSIFFPLFPPSLRSKGGRGRKKR